MIRRDFAAGLGATLIWPLGARAQVGSRPVIGFLSSVSTPITRTRIESFKPGLQEIGYFVDRNVEIELRSAEGQYEHLPKLAAELVARKVNLIATIAPPAAHAAKAATSTIPIVFVGAYDPVKAGLVASLHRPGGNITGITFVAASLSAKRLELLREIVPNARVIAVLTNPNSPDSVQELAELRAAAQVEQQELVVYNATRENDIDAAFATFIDRRAAAVIVGTDPFFFQRSRQLVALAAQHRLPAIYANDETVALGGLMSYAGNIPEACRLAGIYAGKILKGEKPANLPVQQSAKVDLIINLKTAKALQIQIPQTLTARADQVIE